MSTPDTRTDAQWLGLCLRSESDQPHEWWALGWAVRNRLSSARFPSTVYGVVTQRAQFSYFNAYQQLVGDPGRLWAAAVAGYAGEEQGWQENNLSRAILCAEHVLLSFRWRAPFGPGVTHFWSPRSMDPPGREPSWNWSQLRRLTVPGIDPDRFTFAEEV